MVDRGCLNMCKPLSFLVDERVLAQAPVDKMTPLPDTFTPSNYDVMCGRGKACFNHIGNRRFRITIDMNVARYAKATNKQEKSAIVSSIVDTIRDASPNGGFVKKDPKTGRWFDVGDSAAREKVGQALREALSSQRRASKDETSSTRRSVWNRSSILSPVEESGRPISSKSEPALRRDSIDCVDALLLLPGVEQREE